MKYPLIQKPNWVEGYSFLCYSEGVHDFVIVTLMMLNIDLPLACDETNFHPPEQ